VKQCTRFAAAPLLLLISIRKNNLTALARLGSVHNSSASKILSAKAWLQGEKHSKVEHLASIFNAAGAFLSQNIAA
jgi:hypothetical protein